MAIQKTREETKQFIDHLKIELQKVVDGRKEEMKQLSPTVANPNSVSDFEKMSHTETYYYVQGLRYEIKKLRDIINSNILYQKFLCDSSEIWEARRIISDWEVLNKHMEKNPTIKEEWEALLMAIKLTEED